MPFSMYGMERCRLYVDVEYWQAEHDEYRRAYKGPGITVAAPVPVFDTSK
jgi:hypothetical protein